MSKQIKLLVVSAAEVYGKQVSDLALEIWVKALSRFDPSDISVALSKHIESNKFMPTPADIVAMLSPQVTPEHEALEASNKIVEAMSRFGWTNPERAREFMGEIAWEVVTREGGWRSLCERTNSEDLPILKAQWREIAKVVRVRKKQSELEHNSPKLEYLENKKSDQTLKWLLDGAKEGTKKP